MVFRRNPRALPPLTIMDNTVTAVESFRFLGTTISQDLKWVNHIDIVKKAPTKVVLHLPAEEVQPATGAAETVLLSRHRVIIGALLLTFQELYTSRVKKRAQKIPLDPSHPSHLFFELLPSGRRYRALNIRRARHKNSFFPHSIYLMNS